LRLIGLIILLGILGLSVWLNVSAHVKGLRMNKVLFGKGSVILTPPVTDRLLSDLKVGDKAALERWHAYLFISAGYDSNYNASLASSGLKQTFALYEAHERPGRSNFFNRLVYDLRAEHQRKPLSKQVVLSFLGQPDATIQGPDGEMMQYQYSCSGGRNCFSSVVVTNDVVLRIDIYVR